MKEPLLNQIKRISILDLIMAILTLPAVWIMHDKRGSYQ